MISSLGGGSSSILWLLSGVFLIGTILYLLHYLQVTVLGSFTISKHRMDHYGPLIEFFVICIPEIACTECVYKAVPSTTSTLEKLRLSKSLLS